MTGAESLLCSILDCGVLDLSILDDVGYDLEEIVENLRSNGIRPSLDIITGEIFRKGRDALAEKLREKLEKMACERDGCDEGSDKYEMMQEQIDELESCDPEEDVDWFCNCLDTHVYFLNNEDVYRKYLADEISDIESDMGFSF